MKFNTFLCSAVLIYLVKGNCAFGTYNPGDQDSCSPCTGCFSCHPVTGDCTTCPSGFQLTSTTCVSCQNGFYSTDGSVSCTVCQGCLCDPTSGSCSGVNCYAGYEPSGSACTACPQNTYSLGSGGSCLACSPVCQTCNSTTGFCISNATATDSTDSTLQSGSNISLKVYLIILVPLLVISIVLLALIIYTKNSVSKKVHAKESMKTESISHTDISDDVVVYQQSGKKMNEAIKPIKIKTSK